MPHFSRALAVPESKAFQIMYALAQAKLAAAHAKTGQPLEVRAIYEKTIPLVEPLAMAQPANIRAQYITADIYAGV